MLTCTKCNKEKDEDDFRWKYKAQGKRSSWCRKCFSEHERMIWKDDSGRRHRNKTHNGERRIRNTQYVWDYLREHPCIVCGESDPVVLDFDHRDSGHKRGNICDMSRCSLGLETIKEEIGKCDILCANCHRRRTAEQQDWYKNLIRV